jgi:Carotenoid biosynthesis protein
MDAVAYRMHFWNWDWSGTSRNPLKADWFGIPYGNFVGWITVVFCYSIFNRLFQPWLLRNRRTAVRVGCVPVLATIISLGVLSSTEIYLFPALNRLSIMSGPRWLILTALLFLLTLRGWRHRNPSDKKPHPLAIWTPGWFHTFFVYCFFARGFYRENAWMTIATVLNLLIGIAIHCLPLRSSSASHIQAADRLLAGPSGVLDAVL